MKQLVFLATMVMAILCKAQEPSKTLTFGLGVGYAQNGGINAGIFMKNLEKKYGMYFHCRGITGIGNYSSGVNFSDITDTYTNLTKGDTGYLGITTGWMYIVGNTGISIGAGVGYGAKITEYHYIRRHDFQYIPDEYSASTVAETNEKITFEGMLDYKFGSISKRGIGVQIGYNTLHNVFGLLYYSF